MKKMCFRFLPFIMLLLASAAFAAQNEEIFVISGDRTLVMTRSPAASGEKYEALGDSSSAFWIKGNEATLTIAGKTQDQYVLVLNSPHEEELFLSVDGKNYRMRMTESASGVKYEAANDQKTTLCEKGGAAALSVAGVDYPGYDFWYPRRIIWLPE